MSAASITCCTDLNKLTVKIDETVTVSSKGFKSTSLCASDGSKVIVCTTGISKVPRNWGVQTSETGATRLHFQTSDEDTKSLEQFQNKVTEHIIEFKKSFWPKVKGLTDDEIRNSRYDLIKEGKEKQNGGRWPSMVKINIPNQINTPDCSIVDATNQPIETASDLNGQSIKLIVFEITGIFFMGNRAAWGFTKQLKSIKVDESSVSAQVSSLDYMKMAENILETRSRPKRKVLEISKETEKPSVQQTKLKKQKLRC